MSRNRKYKMTAISSKFSEKGGYRAQFVADGYSVDARKDTQGESWNDVYGEAELAVTDGKVTFADPVTRMEGVCMDASFTFDPSAGATVTQVFEDGTELAHHVSIGE